VDFSIVFVLQRNQLIYIEEEREREKYPTVQICVNIVESDAFTGAILY
jgi:hypothetical protein